MNIAILEDDPLEAELVRTTLTQAGHHCQHFSTGAALLAALPRSPFDLLVLDWMLPDMTGHQVLDWVRAHVAGLGGNPQRVFLVGHSAGGAHVATYLADPALAARRTTHVAGAVLISARVAADVLPDNPNAAGVRAYFGDDTSLYAQRSPLTHAHHIDVPLMVVVAEYENPYLDAYGAAFFERIAQARQRTGRPAQAPRFVQMLRHNHTSVVAHFDSGETLLGNAMLDFFRA